MDNLSATPSIHSRHIIRTFTIRWICMHLLKPLHHLLPRSPHNTLDIQPFARRETVTAVLFNTGDRDAAWLGGDYVCAAAGE